MFLTLLPIFATFNAMAVKPPSRLLITKETRIVPYTILDLQVEGEEALSGSCVVRKDGKILLQLSDVSGKFVQSWEVEINNLTVDEARLAILASLKVYIKRPVVHLAITQIPHLKVSFLGEVVHGGALRLPPNTRLSDGVTQAEISSGGDITKIFLRREREDKPGTFLMTGYDLSQISLDPENDPFLKEGDKVYVWKRVLEKEPPAPSLVRVIGEVRRPDGVGFSILPGMRVMDAISSCGGLLATADRAKIILGRRNGETLAFRADHLEAKDLQQNIELQRGDLIIVNRSDRAQVFAVMGEVSEPRTFQYPQGAKINVMQALQLAGGFSKKGDSHRAILSKGYLLNPTGATAIPFDPDKVKKGETANMEMEPGDVLFVEQKRKRPSFLQQVLPLALRFILPF